MEILSEYIAPWALPNEEIPTHLFWKRDFHYDTIIVTLPQDVIVKEFFNVESSEQEGSIITVNKLKTPNFFGFVVALEKLPKEQREKKQIRVDFLSQGEMVYSHVFEVNVFRPKLSLERPPSRMVFTDETKISNLLNITLRLSGFGRIQIRTEISTGGKFRERAEPLYREIVRRMITAFRTGEEPRTGGKSIRIDPLYLQRKAQEYIEKIEKGTPPFLEIDKEDFVDLRNWIIEKDNREKIMELISRHLENMLVDTLIFYFDKHPTDDVTLPQGRPSTIIESATRELRIRFRYRDALMNEYEPVELTLPIEDKRTRKPKPFELPINLKWIRSTISPIKERGN